MVYMKEQREDDKTELFERMPIPRALLKLSVPTVLSSLVMVIYNLADTYFVSLRDDPVQNAAVTLAAPVLLAFNAVNNLFGVGSSSMMSRALGRKDYDIVRQSSAFGFYCALFCGLFFSLLCTVFSGALLRLLGAGPDTVSATWEYMKWTVSFGAVPAILNVVMAYLVRSEGASGHASMGTMSGCLLNILLDPFFILPGGLGMGAAGAGLATFLSNCTACGYFFVLLMIKRGRTYVCIHPRMFAACFRRSVPRMPDERRDRSQGIAKGVFAVGIPACIQNLLNVTGMTVLNNFTSAFGPDAVAAMGIAQKVNMVPMYIAMGVSQGIMPLVSYNYASGDSRRMKRTVIFSGKISISMLTVVAAVYFAVPGFFVGLFMNVESIVSYGSAFLRGMCLGLPFLCMDFLAVGVFQAVGMGKEAFLFAVLRKIVLEIPAIFVLNYFFPLYGLAYSQFVAEVILAIAAVLVLLRLFARSEKRRETGERGGGQ